MKIQPTPDTLKRLHAVHVSRYGSRLRLARAGVPGFRLGELEHLMKLWEEVAQKNFKFNALGHDAKAEVMDAIGDEEDERAFEVEATVNASETPKE